MTANDIGTDTARHMRKEADDEQQALLDSDRRVTFAELLRALEDLDDPDQDNISLCVIRVSDDPTFGLETVPPAAMAAEPAAAAATAARSQMTIVAAASRKRKVVTYRVSMERSA